jgi:pyrimidine-specific ribonucleoside hydrolase/ribosylpyrimidine nucleosidase
MDCDPGIDDAVAMCLAAAYPEKFQFLGITTVAGNQSIEKVTENALRLSGFWKIHAQVAKGSAVPILRAPVDAADIHGGNGIGGVELPASKETPVPEPAVLFIKRKIDELPEGEKVTLVPTGPLTNIALLLRVFPEVSERIEEIVLMGGAASGGNVTETAEFNIYEDPEAAAIVFDSGLPIVMCGLDATNKCGISAEMNAELASSEGLASRTVASMVRFYLEGPAYEGCEIASIHDAVTYMYLLHPEIYRTAKMAVKVDCSEGLNRGMTVCDARRNAVVPESAATVLTDADGAKFQEYLVEAIRRMDERLAK